MNAECNMCKHPKRDLTLNGDKFVKLVKNVLKNGNKSLPPKFKWKCAQNFSIFFA
jgi:hypothetical protein